MPTTRRAESESFRRSPVEAHDEEILADLCIIEAGPVGITIAGELGDRNYRVCLPQAGGRDVERRFQRQSRGESDGYPLYRLDGSRIRAFGREASGTPGSGTWAGLRVPRLIDFEPRDGLRQFGWP